jgi:hypothetical protein
VADALFAHRAYLRESGEGAARELERSQREIEGLAQARFLSHLRRVVPDSERQRLIGLVAAREMDPLSAAEQLMSRAKE